MIKNVAVKKVLKNTLFKGISALNNIIPKNDKTILLYMGNKGISFNNEALLDYLIEHGYNNEFEIFCSVEGKKYFGETLHNIKYINQLQGILVYLTSQHIFYTAGQIPIKPGKGQCVIQMQHGVCDYKTMGALTKINNGDEFFFNHIIAVSPLYIPIEAKEYCCPESCVKLCSEPMADRILHPKHIYQFNGFSKTLLWVPTFRKSDYLGYSDSSYEDLIPLFGDAEYDELNSKLKEQGCLLIVKIHPNQSISNITSNNYSNIQIYSHEEFEKKGMNLYDLMASVDGLIGDYSSASLQFLLTDRPLAFVIPDFEEYKEKRGFVFDNPLDYMPGHIITCKQEFWEFLKDFSIGKDIYIEERKKIKNIIHYYQDGNSCERLLALSGINKA